MTSSDSTDLMFTCCRRKAIQALAKRSYPALFLFGLCQGWPQQPPGQKGDIAREISEIHGEGGIIA